MAATIVSFLIALTKAVPATEGILDQSIILWIHNKNNNAENKILKIRKESRQILEEYKDANTTEDRKRIFKDFVLNSSK